MLPRLSPPQHHLARRGLGVRSKCPTPRPNPAEADCSYVPPDSCSRRLRSPPAIIPSLPLAPAHLKRQLRSQAQELDFRLSALTAADRSTGSRIRTQPPHRPPHLHPRRVVPRGGGSSRRVARTPSAAAAMPDPRLLPVLGASARAPRGCPAPPLARSFLALIGLPKSHLK